MAGKFQVRCRLNGTETVLSNHRSASLCHRRFISMSRLLLLICRNMLQQLHIWEQDPQGRVLNELIQTEGAVTGNYKPAQSVDEHAAEITLAGLPLAGQDVARWTAFLDRLAAAEVTNATLEYDGYGDSGTIDGVYFFQDDHETELDESYEEEMNDLCYTVIPSGFENNDGGFGNVRIDVLDRSITLEHNSRFTDSELFESVWKLPQVVPTEEEIDKANKKGEE